jgi:hypothetical protein
MAQQYYDGWVDIPHIGPGAPEASHEYWERIAREKSAANVAKGSAKPLGLDALFAEKRVIEQAADAQRKQEQAARAIANPGPWLAHLPYMDPLRVADRLRQVTIDVAPPQE